MRIDVDHPLARVAMVFVEGKRVPRCRAVDTDLSLIEFMTATDAETWAGTMTTNPGKEISPILREVAFTTVDKRDCSIIWSNEADHHKAVALLTGI